MRGQAVVRERVPGARRGWIAFLLGALLSAATAAAPAQVQPASSAPGSVLELYRRLRSVGLDAGQVYRVRDAVLDREDIHLSFDDGTLAFTQAVDGRITGALFQGHGEVLVIPPAQPERASMALFTGAPILDEQFTQAYLRFNDDTWRDLHPALRALPAEDAKAFVAQWDAAARALAGADALRLLVNLTTTRAGEAPGRMLRLELSGVHLGVFNINLDTDLPEQVYVGQFNQEQGNSYYDVWAAFPMRSARPPGWEPGNGFAARRKNELRITGYRIVAHVQPPREFEAEAQLQLETGNGGERVLVFELSRFLRVRSVTADDQPLEVIQNEALEGSQLARRGNDLVAVVFPEPLAPDRRLTLRFTYGGPVLSEAGGGLMYVGARGTWYPNWGPAMADYDLEFHYPKGWTLLATGKQISRADSDGEQIARWVSEKPIPMAGFNLGQYASAGAQANGVTIAAYAAPGSPLTAAGEDVVVVPRWFPGTRKREESQVVLPPPDPAVKAEAVARRSAQMVNFLAPRLGAFPYSSLALTDMPGTDSQGWPTLVFLSHYAYMASQASTVAADPYPGILYGSLMEWHETAHQWWGDAVLWKSYRDQWLVEALANYCALMLLQRDRPAEFRTAMEHYRQALLRNGPRGKPYLQAGPVTLGLRLDSSYFPDGYDVVSYGRGTWLLHMLRYLLREGNEAATPAKPTPSERDPDAAFFRVLRKLQERFAGRALSTADLRRAFEEALPRSCFYEDKRSLDWFFQQWVNGMAVPRLKLGEVRITRRPEKTVVTGRILQQEAPPSLVTAVPVYADTGAGRPLWLGRVFAEGPDTGFEFTVPPQTRKILLDPYQTVLTRP